VEAPTPLPIEHQFTPPPDGFVSLMGSLTAFASKTMLALIEDGEVLGSRQLDMANSGCTSIHSKVCDLNELSIRS